MTKSFVESIALAHKAGLQLNPNSHIFGLGVDYPNGADGTTGNLGEEFPEQVHDTPVSEAAVTGMCVGLGSMGTNAIVHHGRIEFALLAMDQILTQAAKWNFMFGGDYPCHFAARINIGRQWGNGPQHTSSYNTLFANTPGLTVLWPSRPSEAYAFTRLLHTTKTPMIQMEHRWLFKTLDDIPDKDDEYAIQTFAIYGNCSDVVILTYGDGLVEALKVRSAVTDRDISVVCITSIVGNRKIADEILEILGKAKTLLLFDTSNFEYGILQSFIGSATLEGLSFTSVLVLAPPFEPVATSPRLIQQHYPTADNAIKKLAELNLTSMKMEEYSFDEVNLPPAFDFKDHQPTKVIKVPIEI